RRHAALHIARVRLKFRKNHASPPCPWDRGRPARIGPRNSDWLCGAWKCGRDAPRSQEGGRQGVAQFLRKVAESEAQWPNPPPSGAHRARNCAREFNAFLADKRTAQTGITFAGFSKDPAFAGQRIVMKRRDFLKSMTAIAAGGALPAAPAVWSPAKAQARQETLLIISESGPNNIDIHRVSTTLPG